MMKYAIQFIQSLLTGIGFLWLFFESYYGLSPQDTHKINFLYFILIGMGIGIIWFITNGLWIAGYLKKSIKIKSNAIDSTITVMFGDLLTQDGYKAVSVNDFFDSTVDEKHVSSRSLHGVMLTKYWGGDITDWDNQVKNDLATITQKETVASRLSPAKNICYPIGTTASVSRKGQDFLCVALSKTCTKSFETSATSHDLQFAMRELLTKARTVCSGRPLNIPLMGSGLARTGVKGDIIVHLLLLAIFEESKTRKITDNIRIVLPKGLRGSIDLTTIQNNWR